MLIDVDGLEDKVKPQIKNTRKYLELAKDTIRSMNIPSDFTERAKLMNMPQVISAIDGNISNVQRWLNEATDNFTSAESNNKGLVENLISSISTSKIDGKKNKKNSKTETKLKSDKAKEKIKNSVKGTLEYLFSKELNKSTDEIESQTASKVIDIIKSKMSNKYNTLKKETKQNSKELFEYLASGQLKTDLQHMEKKRHVYENRKIEQTVENEGFLDGMKKGIEGTFDYVFSGDLITDTVDGAKKTATAIGNGVESAALWAYATGTDIKNEVTNYISNELGLESKLEYVSAKVSDGCEFAYKNILTPTWGAVKKTGASIGNLTIGLAKGVGELSESLLDAIVMLGTGALSVGTGVADGVSYVSALVDGDTKNWESYTKALWKGVMGYVAEEHVDNAFKGFYANNQVGQWLDNNAAEIFKSDGIVPGIASGVGYVAGIAALTLLTLRCRNSCNWSSNRS